MIDDFRNASFSVKLSMISAVLAISALVLASCIRFIELDVIYANTIRTYFLPCCVAYLFMLTFGPFLVNLLVAPSTLVEIRDEEE